MPASAQERLARALEQPKPQEELTRLARQLQSEGMSQDEVLALYTEFFRKHRDDTDETKYDALVEVLTLIAGECGPGARIFPR